MFGLSVGVDVGMYLNSLVGGLFVFERERGLVGGAEGEGGTIFSRLHAQWGAPCHNPEITI